MVYNCGHTRSCGRKVDNLRRLGRGRVSVDLETFKRPPWKGAKIGQAAVGRAGLAQSKASGVRLYESKRGKLLSRKDEIKLPNFSWHFSRYLAELRPIIRSNVPADRVPRADDRREMLVGNKNYRIKSMGSPLVLFAEFENNLIVVLMSIEIWWWPSILK